MAAIFLKNNQVYLIWFLSSFGSLGYPKADFHFFSQKIDRKHHKINYLQRVKDNSIDIYI
jgi:hypothetical protein